MPCHLPGALVLASDYLLNKLARYLVLGILAMALSLSWGYAGILTSARPSASGSVPTAWRWP